MPDHQCVPISKDLDDDSDATSWRCIGCGVTASVPFIGECPASSLWDEGDS